MSPSMHVLALFTTNGKCTIKLLEMCANVQREGRPVEYRWRPLFNAEKFG